MAPSSSGEKDEIRGEETRKRKKRALDSSTKKEKSANVGEGGWHSKGDGARRKQQYHQHPEEMGNGERCREGGRTDTVKKRKK